MTTTIYTCPDCGAQFAATRDWRHCQACDAHGAHPCCGVRAAVRLERARAFLRQGLKPGRGWATLRYDYGDER